MRIFQSNNFSERLRIVLGMIFIVMGIWIIFGDVIPPQWDSTYQILMGVVFVFYGIYRIVHMAYRRNFQKRMTHDIEETERHE